MASPAFRSNSTTNDATAANCTGVDPTGAAADDVLIAHFYIESTTAVTAPTGWSNSFNGVSAVAECTTASHAFKAYLYWIRRGASAPSLVWTHASAYRGLTISAYSGAFGSGDPFSFCSTAVRDDTTAKTYPDVSGTTDTADETLFWGGSFFTEGITSATEPGGFTERKDAAASPQREDADLAKATAGATTATGALFTTAGANQPTSAIMVGLRSAAAPGGGGGGTALHLRLQLEGLTVGSAGGL